ncbi:hypothetical protein ACU6TU_00655 [Halomonas sp. LS-001]
MVAKKALKTLGMTAMGLIFSQLSFADMHTSAEETFSASEFNVEEPSSTTNGQFKQSDDYSNEIGFT